MMMPQNFDTWGQETRKGYPGRKKLIQLSLEKGGGMKAQLVGCTGEKGN